MKTRYVCRSRVSGPSSRSLRRRLALLVTVALVVLTPAACTDQAPTTADVVPLVENAGFEGSGDVSDDTAIWVDRADPSNSVVIADNKARSGGGIGLFDMRGQLLQFRAEGMMGNVDLRGDFPLSGSPVVLVGANNRATNTLALWTLNTTSRRVSPIAAGRIATTAPNYGLCMYHSKRTGKFYAFVTPGEAGSIQQFELLDNGAGRVRANLVRTLPIDSITESCVADDDLGHLYIGQEDVAVWKYGAEPDAGSTRSSVDTAGDGRLVADIEGMTIAYGDNEAGYLFVSSQGNSTIAVYERRGDNAFVKGFRVVANGDIDAVTGTDGLDVTSRDVGPGFESGVLLVHDGSNASGRTSNIKYVPLDAVVELAPPE